MICMILHFYIIEMHKILTESKVFQALKSQMITSSSLVLNINFI